MIIYEIRDPNVPYMLLCIREISESAYTAFKFGVHEYSLSSIIHCNIYTDLDNRPKVANKIFDFNWTLINSTESQKFHKQFGPKLAKKTIPNCLCYFSSKYLTYYLSLSRLLMQTHFGIIVKITPLYYTYSLA